MGVSECLLYIPAEEVDYIEYIVDRVDNITANIGILYRGYTF